MAKKHTFPHLENCKNIESDKEIFDNTSDLDRNMTGIVIKLLRKTCLVFDEKLVLPLGKAGLEMENCYRQHGPPTASATVTLHLHVCELAGNRCKKVH